MKLWSVVLIICVLISNSGCQITSDLISDNETRELAWGVSWEDYDMNSYSWMEHGQELIQELGPHITMDDHDLQERVNESITDVPLDTEDAAVQYAWDIMPALVECGYLKEEWEPILAFHFTNDIWGFYYAYGKADPNSVRDSTTDVYVSQDDGHIIFIYDSPVR